MAQPQGPSNVYFELLLWQCLRKLSNKEKTVTTEMQGEVVTGWYIIGTFTVAV